MPGSGRQEAAALATGLAREVSISLGGEAEGMRLDRFLASELGVSRAAARRLLAAGAVSLDGRVRGYADKGLPLPARGSLRVAAGAGADALEASGQEVVVLAEGPGWIAVDKPAGRPVHPLRAGEARTVLNDLLASRPEIQGVGCEGVLRSGVVHRLDVGTSGVLLFATDDASWARLRRAFREHRVEKRYRAIVGGRAEDLCDALSVAPGEWSEAEELRLAVARHRPARVRVVEGSWGRGRRSYPARQRFRVLEVLRGAALVEVWIETGFLHQIRVALAHRGHPLLGDALYGDEPGLAMGAARPLLHAARLRYEEIEVESPDPPDFRAMLGRLRI